MVGTEEDAVEVVVVKFAMDTVPVAAEYTREGWIV